MQHHNISATLFQMVTTLFQHSNAVFIELKIVVANRLLKDQLDVCTFVVKYRKIPKISPGACIFQRPFLRGLFLEGLILGGAYVRREICV